MLTGPVAHHLAMREEPEHGGPEHESEVEEKQRPVVVLDGRGVGEIVAMDLERAHLLANRRGRSRDGTEITRLNLLRLVSQSLELEAVALDASGRNRGDASAREKQECEHGADAEHG